MFGQLPLASCLFRFYCQCPTESMQSWFWNMLKRLKLHRLIYRLYTCCLSALAEPSGWWWREGERERLYCMYPYYVSLYIYILHINTLHIVNALDTTTCHVTQYPYDNASIIRFVLAISGTTSPPAAMWSKAAVMPRANCGAEWTRTAAFGPTSQGSKAGRCLRSDCWPSLITA